MRRRTGPRSGPYERAGIAWLTPETHARLGEIMVEPSGIPWSYERWREKAETQERHWKRRNQLVVRIVLDPEAFAAWCAGKGLQPNGEALQVYVFQRASGRELG